MELSDEKELPELHDADGAHGETEMPDETEPNTRCIRDPNKTATHICDAAST
jgi:hypothetical protein